MRKSKSHVTEADIRDYFNSEVIKAGGEVRKVEWFNRRGAPDRIAGFSGWHCYCELKAPGQKPEDYQVREINRMLSWGMDVRVVDSFALVDALIMENNFRQAHMVHHVMEVTLN